MIDIRRPRGSGLSPSISGPVRPAGEGCKEVGRGRRQAPADRVLSTERRLASAQEREQGRGRRQAPAQEPPTRVPAEELCLTPSRMTTNRSPGRRLGPLAGGASSAMLY